MPRCAVSDLVLHCLPMSHKKDLRLKWVKTRLQSVIVSCVTGMMHIQSFLENYLITEGFLEKYLKTESLFENKICVLEPHSSIPTKRSDAQPLFEYGIQLPYKSNKKSGNVIQ